MNTNNRRTFSTPSRIALSVLAILASAADAQAVTEWDLPGQPLANTLRDIAARTESNIIFDKKLVRGQTAPALKTRATTEEALSKVLEGTGLTYRQLDDKTVTIQLASTDPASVTGASGASDRIRLAQSQAEAPVARPRPVPENSMPEVMLVEEIVVTGTNIRGIENSTAPITVLSREYINATGYSNTAKLLESVTQNFALANQYGAFVPGVSNNNREQGASVNLRGIAEGTTLVLVNGRRLAPGFRSVAADISALPLSAIERVEILTDGASALYGSDAVGGVVNFILREDFEGVETRLRGGGGDGFNELRGSQAFGNAWDSGNFVASVEYFDRDSLDAADRDFVPPNSLAGTLLPEDETISGMFTVRQDLTGSVSVFADALYADRSSFNRAGRVTFNETASTDNTQTVATAGVDWNFAGDWQLELLGSYANNDLEQVTTTRNGVTPTNPGTPVTTDVDSEFNIQTARLKVDGTLFTWAGGNVRVALGGEFRGEEFDTLTTLRQTNRPLTQLNNEQDVTSGFAEIYAPIVGEGNAIPGVQALELSLAGRYEDYDTAGSSTDPQFGLMWEPVSGLRLRGRYGTSFKAPNLSDYDTSTNNALTGFLPLPTGPAQLLQLGGVNVDGLSPQESESSSFGLELTPPALPGFSVSLNYYTIEYENIVATPANNNSAVALSNPAVYRDIIINNPSVDQVNAAIAASQLGLGFTVLPIPRPDGRPFSPDLVDVLVDLRRRNLSVVKSEGLDLGTQYSFDAGMASVFLGLNGTYILNQESQVTDTAPEVETVDTIYNPPSWRARALFGLQYRGWATNLFVNHTDSYTDNRVIVGQPATREVDAYTTVDLRVAYDFSSLFNSGLLSGFSVALAAQNVLDEDPPSTLVNTTLVNGVNATFDTGFDPANADPLGRVISLEFSKVW